MTKGRLEAFTNAVIAIIMTIMVLELKVPHGISLQALLPLIPVFLSYVLSFVYLGIYWNNHHHLWQAVRHVNGVVLWANLHLLFWLSLIPFATGWMGENHFAALPVALYGFVLLMAAVAYFVMTIVLVRLHGKDSVVARALASVFKERISTVAYVMAIPIAFFNTWISCGLYLMVALIWLVPDPRFEKAVMVKEQGTEQ